MEYENLVTNRFRLEGHIDSLMYESKAGKWRTAANSTTQAADL